MQVQASEYRNMDEFKLTGETPQCVVNILKGLTTVPGVTHSCLARSCEFTVPLCRTLRIDLSCLPEMGEGPYSLPDAASLMTFQSFVDRILKFKTSASAWEYFLSPNLTVHDNPLYSGYYTLQVRIFTYLIGREAAFADNLKWMACANKGFFTQISTLADVQENVMEYLHVLSRPKVIDQEHDVVWTEAYIDSTLADDQGLVLMTTVAMPVFSKQNETRSKGILLGVVGTDVPVKELLKTIPKYKLGIHGYAFAITNNGYILTHPELRPLYEEGKKRRKPNYSSVDLSEVEWEDRDDVLRNAMVNRKTGKFSMEVKKTVDKGKRVLVMTNDYYYTDIKGTPFSLGVALSRGHGKYFFRGNVTVEEGLHDLEHPDVSLADEWSYCNTDLHPEHRQMTQLEAIKRYLTGKEPLLQCKYFVNRGFAAFIPAKTCPT
ncbi:hypothetical protein DUI87_23366 [Hirundo rustica rustica]|uniref:Cache domain-containing protein n=1 Tax=Hirundo rustica rustica TaxID=333673 RepID=A0A3M0JFR9_HIRRU|nr:hypothetical protein DUI87_23366 [Hirundo rustica rustica]